MPPRTCRVWSWRAEIDVGTVYDRHPRADPPATVAWLAFDITGQHKSRISLHLSDP